MGLPLGGLILRGGLIPEDGVTFRRADTQGEACNIMAIPLRYVLVSTLVLWWQGWWGRRCHGTVCLGTQSTPPIEWSPTVLQTMSTSVRPHTGKFFVN